MSTTHASKAALPSGFFTQGSMESSTVVLAGFESGGSDSHIRKLSLFKRLRDNGLHVFASGETLPRQMDIVATAIIGAGKLNEHSAALSKFLEEPTVKQALHRILLVDDVSDSLFTQVLPSWLAKWPEAIFARSQDEAVSLTLQYVMQSWAETTSPGAALAPKAISSLRRMLELGESLRNPESDELDAKRVAALFKLPHAEIARWAGVSPQALDQHPTSEALQPVLRLLERVGRLRVMRQVDEEKLRQWFRTPLPRLEQRTPFELFQKGTGERVAELVDNLVSGQFA